jgi:hypothetical protein
VPGTARKIPPECAPSGDAPPRRPFVPSLEEPAITKAGLRLNRARHDRGDGGEAHPHRQAEDTAGSPVARGPSPRPTRPRCRPGQSARPRRPSESEGARQVMGATASGAVVEVSRQTAGAAGAPSRVCATTGRAAAASRCCWKKTTTRPGSKPLHPPLGSCELPAEPTASRDPVKALPRYRA